MSTASARRSVSSRSRYYGFSWGTDLGQVYATLFPTHVRRLILDSNVNPLRDGYQDFNLDQDPPFNRNENIWFGWLAKYNSVYHLGATESAVAHLFYSTENQLIAHPVDGVVGPDEWADIFEDAAYYEETWVELGQAFSDWINDPGATSANELIELYQGTDGPGDDNEFAVYLSVLCTDYNGRPIGMRGTATHGRYSVLRRSWPGVTRGSTPRASTGPPRRSRASRSTATASRAPY